MAITITLTGKNADYLKALVREKPRLGYADVQAAANGEIEYAGKRREALAKDQSKPMEQKHQAKTEKPAKEKKADKPKAKAEVKADKKATKPEKKAESKKAAPVKAAKPKAKAAAAAKAKPVKAASKPKAKDKVKKAAKAGKPPAPPVHEEEEVLENGSMEEIADQVDAEEAEAEL